MAHAVAAVHRAAGTGQALAGRLYRSSNPHVRALLAEAPRGMAHVRRAAVGRSRSVTAVARRPSAPRAHTRSARPGPAAASAPATLRIRTPSHRPARAVA
ncbi:hypothetical protein GCM10010425_24930 [Streptomyces spororaveus]|uniref:Uncharacterized protein n=1 Tax=Streptomyces spororaveus TaxID=284039 RepID=A0ABQ3TGN7_9ACTN|nr:hypothetical protein Sspor_51310 [Streptomyces spororaveus]